MRRVNATRANPVTAAIVPAFRFVANLEALSWLGLLTGMVFKYALTGFGELGAELVTLFGRLHGGLVVVYVALAAMTAIRQRWPRATTGLAIAATVPPFATVAFDAWAHRSGRYAPRDARVAGTVERSTRRS